MKMKVLVIAVSCAVFGLTGCQSDGGPKLVDDSLQGAKVSFGNLEQVAANMSDKLLSSGFFRNKREVPVIMVLSDIENHTDVRDLPTDSVLGRIRARCLDSGLIQFVSSFGAGTTDQMTGEIQDIANDPRFNKSQAPKRGSLTVPTHSLRTEINYKRDQVGKSTQRNYDFHMFVSNLETGVIEWEQFEKVQIRVGKGSVGS